MSTQQSPGLVAAPLHYDRLRKGARTALIVQGVLSIIMGVLFLLMPMATAFVVAIFFAAWLVVNGVVAIISHFQRDKDHRSAWVLVSAILSIVVGIVAVFLPSSTVLALALLVGAWAFVVGAFAIAGAFSLKKMGAKHWWVMLINGVVGIVVGIVFVVSPANAFLGFIWALGIFAVADGIAEIVLGIRTRRATSE